MKKAIFASLSVLFLLAACAGTISTPTISQTTDLAPNQNLPTATSVNSNSIKPYDDVRGLSLMHLSQKIDQNLIETLWFDDTTQWPRDAGTIAGEILEAAKNPGLGVRSLHEQGITGKGVNVAIIDQNLILDHPEFKGKIIKYFDTGTGQASNSGSMHGTAVASLLAGTTIGTAPGANLYFAAAPTWKNDAKYYADALDWIVEQNKSLPEGQKIRVVSVSAAPSGPGSLFTKNNSDWDEAYQKATEAGILVLDCTEDHGIVGPCYLDESDPENPAKCTPGFPGMDFKGDLSHIYVPTSPRTTAKEFTTEDISYQYTGRGGLSWGIPYLAGVLAMGWQINPELSNDEIVKLVFDSAYVRDDKVKIIDPKKFIEMVKATVK